MFAFARFAAVGKMEREKRRRMAERIAFARLRVNIPKTRRTRTGIVVFESKHVKGKRPKIKISYILIVNISYACEMGESEKVRESGVRRYSKILEMPK